MYKIFFRQNSAEYNRSFSDAPPNSPKALLEADNSQASSHHNFKLENIGSKQVRLFTF